jgi:hypothetical protein
MSNSSHRARCRSGTALALLLLLGIGAWFGAGGRTIVAACGGGWLIVGLAVTIGLIVVIGIAVNPNVFWNFFTGFHTLFFEGDSWMFLYSDTLIRLFPIRFWQDAFLWAALLALAGGIGLALGLKPK